MVLEGYSKSKICVLKFESKFSGVRTEKMHNFKFSIFFINLVTPHWAPRTLT